MNNLNPWREVYGRIRAIGFYCQRCHTIHFEIISEEMVEHSEDNLQRYEPPLGWAGHECGLLCDKCAEEYRKFMKGANNE